MTPIEEYVLLFGFKVDANGQKKFRDELGANRMRLLELGSAAVSSSLAVTKSVEATASKYNDLTYATTRLGTTIINLQKYQYAAENIGSSAEAARGEVESFSAALRNNPPLKGFIEDTLQVKLTGDAVEDLNATMQKLAATGRQGVGQHAIAAGAAEMLGQSEVSLKRFEDFGDKISGFMAEYQKKQDNSGIDLKQASKDSVEFTNAMNSLSASLVLLRDRIGLDWMASVTPMLKALTEITDSVTRLDKQTHGLVGTLGLLATTGLGGAALAKVVRGGLRLVGIGGAAAGGGTVAGETGAGLLGGVLKGGILRSILGPLGILLGSTETANKGEIDIEKMSPAARAAYLNRGMQGPTEFGQGMTGDVPAGIANNNPGMINDGTGAIFQYDTQAQGLKALIDKIKEGAEQKTLEQIASAVMQGGDARDLIKSMSGSIKDAGGNSLTTNIPVDLSDPATVKAIADAVIAARNNGMNPYSGDTLDAARGRYYEPQASLGADGRGGGDIKIENKTSLTIHTSDDPAAISQAVSDAGNRVNADTVRLMDSRIT